MKIMEMHAPKLNSPGRSSAREANSRAFTLVEVCIALLISLIFAGAVFATNQYVLNGVRSQRETAAAARMLEERMENFRVWPYSDIASFSFVNNYIVSRPTNSEAMLGGITGSLQETVTVSGYLTAGATAQNPNGYPGDGSVPNRWFRNAQNPNGVKVYQNDGLATNYDLLQVNIVISWTGAGGRGRTRELSAIFGRGNSGW